MLIVKLHNIVMEVLSRFITIRIITISVLCESYNEHAVKIQICIKMVDTMCWN